MAINYLDSLFFDLHNIKSLYFFIIAWESNFFIKLQYSAIFL